jgi:hypothetical protein
MNTKMSSFPDPTGPSADLLFEKLQEPGVVRSLVSLLEKSQALNDFLENGEEMLNSITEGVGQLGRVGVATLSKSLETVDLDELRAAAGNLQGMIPAIRGFVSELGSLQKAGLFDPEVIKILGRAGRAMSAAVQDPEAHSNATRGIFSIIGLLKDPQIARTLNFFISFARHFGGDLSKDGALSVKK